MVLVLCVLENQNLDAFPRGTGCPVVALLRRCRTPSTPRIAVIVITVGLRSRGQHSFGLLQMAACPSQQCGQLAVDPPRLLQFVQKRLDRRSPPGVLAQIANVLPPIPPPAQLVVWATLLPVFGGDKALSRQRLHICRRQTQAGQPVATSRVRLDLCRFGHLCCHWQRSRIRFPRRPVSAKYCVSAVSGSGSLLPAKALSNWRACRVNISGLRRCSK